MDMKHYCIRIPGMNKISKIGTDLLSSAIWLNAKTK